MTREKGTDGQNAVADRALDILLSFNDDSPVMTAADIQKQYGFSRSTVYRYIASLRSKGLITEDVGGGYRLGPRLIQMARIARQGNSIIALAEPDLKALSEACGEVIQLTERVGTENIVLEVIEGRHRIGITYMRGQMLPSPFGSAAKVLLAFAPEADREALLTSVQLHAYTPHSITDLTAFREELEAVRLNGYAVNREEIDVGVRAVAAPVKGRKGINHALSIVAPAFRMADDKLPEFAALVRDYAARISDRVRVAGY
jgi:DNA-binding IclR family transcriptional regulator